MTGFVVHFSDPIGRYFWRKPEEGLDIYTLKVYGWQKSRRGYEFWLSCDCDDAMFSPGLIPDSDHPYSKFENE